jgi:murein DD-endopeptidase MepM/ murein hydrolase activator NlpD
MGVAACPRCERDVALHEGRPFVSPSGAVELWHATCWSVRDTRPVEDIEVVAVTSAQRQRIPVRAIAAGAGVATLAMLAYVGRVELPSASLAAISIEPHEAPNVGAQLTEREVAPPIPDDRARFPVPDSHGLPLDEMYPSLLDWSHPVTATDNVLSPQSTGMFGAERDGVRRSECGEGHCGVDLAGPIGRPIVAVADGVIVRVEHSELGRDGRSGRYVRIEHPDGSLTAYMHLDQIEEGLEVGDSVDGGQQIGTLGATAISRAVPHVHFSLEVPKIPGTHGDHANTVYVDPAPFLVRATIVPAADRRRPEKPAF